MARRLGLVVLLAGCAWLLRVAPIAAVQGPASGLREPIAVEGGQVTGTPSVQWTPGVRLFRGIPYAAAPVGNLRWRPPQPVVPWQGVKRADHFSPACMQRPTSTEGNAWREGHVPVSEDCLYLNVWTPARSAADRLPVMVWIHGGGNTRGAASENQYDGAYLAKKGVVFVSFNYRMNVFGFMAHPELTRESDHRSSGNYALLDQIAALQWVQRNIAGFGGDPSNVMLFGHSAGASNVVSLLASPLAKGLFHRAAAMSGASLAMRTTLPEAEKAGVALGQLLGAPSLAELRKKSAEDLLEAKGPRMGPVVDGWVLPESVYSVFAAGRQAHVPLLVGTVADDAPGPGSAQTAAEAQAGARSTYGDRADKYLALYPATTDAEAAKSAHAFRTNSALAGARLLARLHSKTGQSPVYWYYFTHTSPMPQGAVWDGRPASSWGAYHGSELMYAFNALPFQDWAWRLVDRKLAETVSSMWVSFARSGSPNGGPLPHWPAFDPKLDVLMDFADMPKAHAAPHKARIDFIDDWLAAQRSRSAPTERREQGAAAAGLPPGQQGRGRGGQPIALGPDDKPIAAPAPEGFNTPRDGIAHGRIDIVEYDSKTVGNKRRALVYTPPNYAAGTTYPVLYLLHGIGGDEDEWRRGANPQAILDNLIADRKAVPMIVVMPNGRAQPNDRVEGNVMASAPAFARFERDLVDDLIPFIESRYPVRRDRESRALAGLSMGGGQALNFGLGHLDLFAWIGGFSSAPNTKLPEELVPNPAEAARRLRLLWISCGDRDGLFSISQRTHAYLKDKNVPHSWHVDSGAHDFTVWSNDLYLFAQRIFSARQPAGGGAPRVLVDDDGTVHVPAQVVPMSSFLSPEAKAYVTAHLKDMQSPPPGGEPGVPGFMAPYLKRQREIYPAERQDTTIAGVHAFVYVPKAGIAPKNKTRVLINLHGGGFSGCWPGCAEVESIPVAGVGKIKVVSVDYRQGPQYKFPAASEDVAAVYKELLKTYRPENVGVFGCSAGGMLTAMSVAWFQKHNLPRPGAVGIFCAGAGSPTGAGFGGDASYTAQPLGEARVVPTAPPAGGPRGGLGYLAGTDPKDPLVAPINSPETLAKFPPTLIITGTRGFELSGALYTHTQLVKQGVDADLHVWEGLFHGFFYNPDVPESRDAYDVMVKFFDRRLGRK